MNLTSEPTTVSGYKCKAQIAEPPHYLHTHDCSRAATSMIDGVWLCTQHATKALKRGIRSVT